MGKKLNTQNFSQLVTSAECQEMGKCVCTDVCEEELKTSPGRTPKEKHSFELVIPVMCGFHEIQAVRV